MSALPAWGSGVLLVTRKQTAPGCTGAFVRGKQPARGSAIRLVTRQVPARGSAFRLVTRKAPAETLDRHTRAGRVTGTHARMQVRTPARAHAPVCGGPVRERDIVYTLAHALHST